MSSVVRSSPDPDPDPNPNPNLNPNPNPNPNPNQVRYRCLRHTWACMQPSFEVGGQGRGEGFSVEHEEEKDGALVAWLAARPEPWLQLSLQEQTALEPSGPVAGAILSGVWARNIRARLGGATAMDRGRVVTEPHSSIAR